MRLLVLTVLAVCIGCGGGDPKPAATPSAADRAEVPVGMSDEERDDAPEIGSEGDDETPPLESMPAPKPAAGPGTTALIAEVDRQLGIMAREALREFFRFDSRERPRRSLAPCRAGRGSRSGGRRRLASAD
jgi:hypothetical protein